MKDRASLALFDDAAPPLAAQLAAWCGASPRFAAFVEEHRDKIRKKARGARDPEALDDLLLELAVAHDLHRERLGEIAYEPRLPGRTRMPDFALTLRNGTAVMVEVTRLRPSIMIASAEPTGGTPRAAGDVPAVDVRLSVLVCGKLGQLVPNLANVLIAGLPAEAFAALDVGAAMRALLGRAERRELTARERHYIRTPPDFFRPYRYLSGLLVRPWPPSAAALPATFWVNRQAARTIPPRLRACLTDDSDDHPIGGHDDGPG